jgi:hypothetical protein
MLILPPTKEAKIGLKELEIDEPLVSKEVSSKKKEKYRTSNRPEYNRSLANRRSITFWFSKDVTNSWYSTQRTARKGRPETYSDDAIWCGLMIKVLFRIPFCLLEGFVSSLMGILSFELSCPELGI